MGDKEIQSEFGKGFVYNLILFAKHWMMFSETLKREDLHFGYDLWFNGASDHFYDLEIPQQFIDTEIGKLAQEIRDTALHLGHGFAEKATKKDYDEIFEKLEKLGMLIDKQLGVEPVKAQWN